MSEANDTPSVVTHEVVGVFAERAGFDRAVRDLTAAGFERADLSVLSSHESLDVAGKPPDPGDPDSPTGAAILADLKYVGPIFLAGLIALGTGPVAGTVAALAAAALGGMAIKEALDKTFASPHTDDFVRAIEAGGLILWVRAETPDREERAKAILSAAGGEHVHTTERRSPTA